MDKFSKEHTLVTKGILVIILLAHHVFFPEDIAGRKINTIIDNPLLFNNIIMFFKICIAGFAFLTAYGMTRNFKMGGADKPEKFFYLTIKRLVKLESAIIIVYILAVIYKRFVMAESLESLYIGEETDIAAMLVRMFIDMLGMANYARTPILNVTWWYLSYAILLIAAMPFIYMAYEKFRYLLLPAGCLLPFAILNSGASFSLLLPIVILGTAFSYEDWFEKLKCSTKSKAAIGLLVSCAIIYLSYLFYTYVNPVFGYSLAFIIPYLAYQYISGIPVISNCLKYIGKHATNIFLVHTFIYRNYYSDFIYSLGATWYILPALLGLSLGVSIVIELIKKVSGYNLIVSKILKNIDDEACES